MVPKEAIIGSAAGCVWNVWSVAATSREEYRSVAATSLTCSEEDVLLHARANKGYQVVFIHNRYFIVFLCVNTRDTRLYFYHKYFIVFCVHFGEKIFRWLSV